MRMIIEAQIDGSGGEAIWLAKFERLDGVLKQLVWLPPVLTALTNKKVNLSKCARAPL